MQGLTLPPGASPAGAAGAAAPSSAAAAAAFFETFSRGTNFFLGLGNSKASPLRFWAAPPSSLYPPGVVLCPCNHLVHRREDLYPEPERFRPERFLERHYPAHEWFPFGGGGRMCLGMAFALYEMKVVLSTLFATVRLCVPRPPIQPDSPGPRPCAR